MEPVARGIATLELRRGEFGDVHEQLLLGDAREARLEVLPRRRRSLRPGQDEEEQRRAHR
ncbi:MAG: hypothetical protein HOP15_11325 [Planctomycetes bacterium]|nr:hypothetical protein [Planctomycetota bacterium]